MMTKEKIERINYLARKSKKEGLTKEEKLEQKKLRSEYIQNFRKSFKNQITSFDGHRSIRERCDTGKSQTN